MTVERIAIYGAGGMGREVFQLIRDINRVQARWDCVGFIVDSGFGDAATVAGLPVLGDVAWLVANPDVRLIVAVGSSAARWRIVNKIKSQCNPEFPVLIHPRAWVGDNVTIGAGTVICAGALITTDIRIGEHSHVNFGAAIGHDAVLADYVSLNPGVNISGNVSVACGAEVGTGSAVIPRCAIGEWSLVGAGSVVTKAVPPNCTAVGSPARSIKLRPAGWHEGQ